MSSYVYVKLLHRSQRENTTCAVIRTAGLHPGKLHHTNQKSESAALKAPHPILQETTDRSNSGETRNAWQMRLHVFRRANAVTEPCCKLVRVTDSLRELFYKDKANDRR